MSVVAAPNYIYIHSVYSYVPNPATGFSFHAVEAIITGGFNPMLACLLKFNPTTVILCQLYGLISTVNVHAGYEYSPFWWNKIPFTGWYT